MRPVNKNILVVDDSNTNLVLLEAVFSSNGYTIFTAISVKDAFSIIKNNTPALILLDLNMPELSGYDFLEKIKADIELKDIPIIIVSALSDEASISKSISLGASEFVKKPVDIPLLKELVSKYLK